MHSKWSACIMSSQALSKILININGAIQMNVERIAHVQVYIGVWCVCICIFSFSVVHDHTHTLTCIMYATPSPKPLHIIKMFQSCSITHRIVAWHYIYFKSRQENSTSNICILKWNFWTFHAWFKVLRKNKFAAHIFFSCQLCHGHWFWIRISD